MDTVDISNAPPEYLEIAWLADICKLTMAIGFIVSYVAMISKSFKDRTYGLAWMPLCCNFAWELVYIFMYPFESPARRLVFALGFGPNCILMYTAFKFAANEWGHAPVIQRNIPLILFVTTFGWITAHLAIAVQFGAAQAQAYVAYFCTLFWSSGQICQLLSRGTSRGTSYTIWLGRFLGTVALIPQDILRYNYWRKDHERFGTPLYIWFVCTFLILNFIYGICFWNIRRSEQQMEKTDKARR